jgi:tetratricopeptide (TPR) repeat protein
MEPDSEMTTVRRRLQQGLQFAAVGEMEAALGTFDSLLRDLRAGDTRGEELALVARNAGILCRQMGRTNLALRYFEEALALSTSVGWDALAVAMCHAERGDEVAARQYLRIAKRWATDSADDELAQIVSSREASLSTR